MREIKQRSGEEQKIQEEKMKNFENVIFSKVGIDAEENQKRAYASIWDKNCFIFSESEGGTDAIYLRVQKENESVYTKQNMEWPEVEYCGDCVEKYFFSLEEARDWAEKIISEVTAHFKKLTDQEKIQKKFAEMNVIDYFSFFFD